MNKQCPVPLLRIIPQERERKSLDCVVISYTIELLTGIVVKKRACCSQPTLDVAVMDAERGKKKKNLFEQAPPPSLASLWRG